MAKQFLVDLDFNSVAKITNLPDPTAAQDAATKAYVDGAVEGIAWKDSVRVASTANVTVSGPGTTIDGITLSASDRILLKNQTTASENGIYVFTASGTAATRATDASTFAELEGAVVVVEEGTTNAGTTWRQTAVNGTIGSSSVAFTAFIAASGAASETSAGIAEIATQTETDTGTDDLRIVTPLKLTTWSGRKLKFSANLGDGSATSFNIDHNFGTRDVTVEVYRNSGSYDTVIADVTRTSTNRVVVAFTAAPASNAYRVVVLG